MQTFWSLLSVSGVGEVLRVGPSLPGAAAAAAGPARAGHRPRVPPRRRRVMHRVLLHMRDPRLMFLVMMMQLLRQQRLDQRKDLCQERDLDNRGDLEQRCRHHSQE